MARLRCVYHILKQETGRQIETPGDLRVCKLRHTNMIENEHHFLLCRSAYSSLIIMFFRSLHKPLCIQFSAAYVMLTTNIVRHLSFCLWLRGEIIIVNKQWLMERTCLHCLSHWSQRTRVYKCNDNFVHVVLCSNIYIRNSYCLHDII